MITIPCTRSPVVSTFFDISLPHLEEHGAAHPERLAEIPQFLVGIAEIVEHTVELRATVGLDKDCVFHSRLLLVGIRIA